MTVLAIRNAPITTSALILMLTGASAGHAEPFLYVPTTGDPGKIEIVDVATNKRVKTIGPFEDAHGLAGATNGRYLVVGSLAERDVASQVEKPKAVGASDHAAHHGKPMPTNAASTPGVSTLSVIDRASGEVVRRIDVPGSVHHVALSPDARLAAATHPSNASVSVVSLETFELVATVQTGVDPNYAAFSPDGQALYVSIAGENRLAIIDTSAWRVSAKIAVGASPEHLRATQNGETLFVNNVDDGSVSVIDLSKRMVVKTYELGARLHGIDLTDDERALIVSLRGSDRVARVGLDGGLLRTTELGPSPYHVTTVQGTGRVYVSSSEQNTITVLDQRDLSIVARIPVDGIGHQMLPVFATAKEIGVEK